MTAPYMGGFQITSVGWLSAGAIAVRFSTSYGSDYCYQLYAGRTLIGTTKSGGARDVVGQLEPSTWPQHLTVLAVSPSNKWTDYGASLPLRPYNRVRLRFKTASWPADSRMIEVSAGTVVGGAVDTDNVVARIPFDTDGDFEIFSPPMPGTGQWNFQIAGRDNRPNDGNRGTALAVSANVLAHPPDVVLQDDDSRFSVVVAGGEATVTLENP
jgi:hypothetical protein